MLLLNRQVFEDIFSAKASIFDDLYIPNSIIFKFLKGTTIPHNLSFDENKVEMIRNARKLSSSYK